MGRRRARRSHACRDSQGFTLIELLLVVVILAIVGGVVATGIVVSGKSTAQTTAQYSESHDAQLASAYWAADVQNANTVSFTTQCGGTETASLSNLINFVYGDGEIASYWKGNGRLVRVDCPAGGTGNSAVVVYNLDNTSGPQCTYATNAPGPCALSDSQPNDVTVAITEADGYTYSLSGSRRTFAGTVPQAQLGYPPLLVLGPKGQTITVAGGSNLKVNGPVISNSTGDNQNDSIKQNGNGLDAPSVEVMFPGQCNCAYNVRSTPLPDPFAGLPIPDEAPFLAANPPKVFFDGNPDNGPGVYRQTPLTFRSTTQPLEAGMYIVESGFNFQGGAKVTSAGNGGVLLFNGCGLNAPTDCRNDGNFQLTGSAELKLDPINDGSLYAQARLVIWQPADNATNMNIAGAASASSITGVIYAPKANVTLSGGTAGLTIGAVIAADIDASGGGQVVIG